MTRGIIALIREEVGDDAVDELLREADSSHDAEFLSRTENWISLAEAISLLEAGARITGDPEFPRNAGAATVRFNLGSQVATLQRSQGSLHEALAGSAIASGRFSTVTEMEVFEAEPGRIVTVARPRPGFERAKAHCMWTTGLLSKTALIAGLPPADVVEIECAAEGGKPCHYEVTWDADEAAEMADPAKRVTA